MDKGDSQAGKFLYEDFPEEEITWGKEDEQRFESLNQS